MQVFTWTVGICLLAQIPPPDTGPGVAVTLKHAQRVIEEREASSLRKLADSLTGKDAAQARLEIQRLLPRPRQENGPDRIMPLPEVVARTSRSGLASVSPRTGNPAARGSGDAWRAELERIRSRAASELFEVANRAATSRPPEYARAAFCLRAVLDRQPDHAAARRLLGYIPHDGGWARPFAARQLKEGNVNHLVFGWVPKDWGEHLDRGELPYMTARGQKPRWLPAEEADRLRANWKNPWQISTEHFEIQTDVPLSEGIEFARRLEAFYDVFFTQLADLVGENLPLARRFRSPTTSAEATYRPHRVLYFGTRDEYLEHLQPLTTDDITESLGYYSPAKAGKGNRAATYFFRDAGGQLPVTATLYHEVSHQLLFETAGPNAFTRNYSGYWVFEGLGTYFETATPQSDGSLEIGGFVGERLAAAQQSLAAGRFLPLDPFLRLDKPGFESRERIHTNYQQAMALAVFLMQWHDAVYREPFLDFVHDAYRGRIKRTTGRSLEDRIGEPVPALDARFRAFVARGG